MRESWQVWAAVREAVAPGHPWAYGADQLLYHYTADRTHLARCVERYKAELEASAAQTP